MAKASRDKGQRREREFVELCRKAGINAEKVPLSGAARYQGNGHDVDVYHVRRDAPLCGECKARADGFKQLYDWLDQDNDFLALKADRKGWLVVLPLDRFHEIMGLLCPHQPVHGQWRRI